MRKENLNKIITTTALAFFILLEFKSFAQLPGDEDQDGGLENGDGLPPADIDSPLWLVVLLLGIALVYIHFRNTNTTKNRNA